MNTISPYQVLHLLDKAEDGAAAVETVVQHNLYPLLINCLIEGYYFLYAHTLFNPVESYAL